MSQGKPKARSEVDRPAVAEVNTFVFRAALHDSAAVYREIELLGDKSLVDLAKAIVKAFDFEFDHAFGFYSKLTGRDVMRSQPKYELFADMDGETDAQSVKRTRISKAFPAVGRRMLFLFDYGDDWRFVVEVIGVGKTEPKTRYPRVLQKVGASPEQYGGGDEGEEDDDDEG